MALNGGLKGDETVLRLEDLCLAIACGEIGCTLGNTSGNGRTAESKAFDHADAGGQRPAYRGLGRKQGVPSAESKISPVSTRAEFPGTSRLSTQRSSLFYRRFVTAAGADLMQLDDVAEGVSHKYLIGILSD